MALRRSYHKRTRCDLVGYYTTEDREMARVPMTLSLLSFYSAFKFVTRPNNIKGCGYFDHL